MKIGLIDVDSKSPNLALMKISSYHRSIGDLVEITLPFFAPGYDIIYASKVFSWTSMPGIPETSHIGGPGSGDNNSLPGQINNVCPDYDLYGINYSMGFLTRGCPRSCNWCNVPKMEGGIRPEHDIELFLRHRRVVLMDNNVLASDYGLDQIIKIAKMDVRVDFNQGLDARLIDRGIANILAKVKWTRFIRVSCDYPAMIADVQRAVAHLKAAGYSGEISCYVLAEEIDSALERIEALQEMGIDPFVQPYRPLSGGQPSPLLKKFAKWVNRKALFKSVSWEVYSAQGRCDGRSCCYRRRHPILG